MLPGRSVFNFDLFLTYSLFKRHFTFSRESRTLHILINTPNHLTNTVFIFYIIYVLFEDRKSIQWPHNQAHLPFYPHQNWNSPKTKPSESIRNGMRDKKAKPRNKVNNENMNALIECLLVLLLLSLCATFNKMPLVRQMK